MTLFPVSGELSAHPGISPDIRSISGTRNVPCTAGIPCTRSIPCPGNSPVLLDSPDLLCPGSSVAQPGWEEKSLLHKLGCLGLELGCT